VVFLLAAACDLGNLICTGGSTCATSTVSGPSAIATPSPSVRPTMSPTPEAADPCLPTRMTLGFHSAAADDRDIAPGESRRLDATPRSGEVQIPDSCNRNRFPIWYLETSRVVMGAPSSCTLTDTAQNYTPTLRASTRAGDRCIVTAVLAIPLADRIEQFNAIFEASVR